MQATIFIQLGRSLLKMGFDENKDLCNSAQKNWNGNALGKRELHPKAEKVRLIAIASTRNSFMD